MIEKFEYFNLDLAIDHENLLLKIDGSPSKLVEHLFENFLPFCMDCSLEEISEVYDAFSESSCYSLLRSDFHESIEMLFSSIPLRQYAICKGSSESSNRANQFRPTYSLASSKIFRYKKTVFQYVKHFSDHICNFSGLGVHSHLSAFMNEYFTYARIITNPNVALITRHESFDQIRQLCTILSSLEKPMLSGKTEYHQKIDEKEDDESAIINVSNIQTPIKSIALPEDDFSFDDGDSIEDVEYFSSSE
jgi:hypothetical protein